MMKKKVELPLAEPIYSTYNNQSGGAVTIAANPSIRNWYLNQSMILQCNQKFLSGYTSPEIDIYRSGFYNNPHLERQYYGMRFTKDFLPQMIPDMLNEGYYVFFSGVDDYYVEGKSWYHERHNNHDGLIYGCDQENGTYSIFSYDSRWIARGFQTSQKSFYAGMQAMFDEGVYEKICTIKPKDNLVAFDPQMVCQKLREYLASDASVFPKTKEPKFYGIIVQDYIVVYIDKLMDGSIPYERMDRRVFRLIWEHKKAMLERLQKAEEVLGIPSEFSTAYAKIVEEANTMRMLYASHHMKRRDSVLPVIRSKLCWIREREEEILTAFVEKAGGVMGA